MHDIFLEAVSEYMNVTIHLLSIDYVQSIYTELRVMLPVLDPVTNWR